MNFTEKLIDRLIKAETDTKAIKLADLYVTDKPDTFKGEHELGQFLTNHADFTGILLLQSSRGVPNSELSLFPAYYKRGKRIYSHPDHEVLFDGSEMLLWIIRIIYPPHMT